MKALFSLRPQPDCQNDVMALTHQGLEAFSLPMLKIQGDQAALSKAIDLIVPSSPALIILTSKQAARLLVKYHHSCNQKQSCLSNIPIWCVGGSTAMIIKQAGFSYVHKGVAGGRDLADNMISFYAGDALPFCLWLSGQDIHFNIIEYLIKHGFSGTRRVVYQAVAANPDPTILRQFLDKGYNCGLLAMSVRTIQQLMVWLNSHDVIKYQPQIHLMLANAEMAEWINYKGFSKFFADSPSHEAMISLAKKWAENKQVGC